MESTKLPPLILFQVLEPMRKIGLTIARSDKEAKTSIRGRVQQMDWSEDYLESLLFVARV